MSVTSVIAHRGANRVFRENTVEAFMEARRMGADMVELDVRMTADAALVIHHDAAIAELGPIAELPVAGLPEWVPLLDAAVEACDGMDINIEIKGLPHEPDGHLNPALAEAVAGFIVDQQLTDRVIVSSFGMAIIDTVRSVSGSIPTAWLTGAGWDLLRAVDQVAERGHVALHPYHATVTAEVVAKAHAAGIAVNTWTCNEAEHMVELAGWGVDGICTDVPDLALATLGRTPAP